MCRTLSRTVRTNYRRCMTVDHRVTVTFPHSRTHAAPAHHPEVGAGRLVCDLRGRTYPGGRARHPDVPVVCMYGRCCHCIRISVESGPWCACARGAHSAVWWSMWTSILDVEGSDGCPDLWRTNTNRPDHLSLVCVRPTVITVTSSSISTPTQHPIWSVLAVCVGVWKHASTPAPTGGWRLVGSTTSLCVLTTQGSYVR